MKMNVYCTILHSLLLFLIPHSSTPFLWRHMANLENCALCTLWVVVFGFLTICDSFWPQETKMRVHSTAQARTDWECVREKERRTKTDIDMKTERPRHRKRGEKRNSHTAANITPWNLFGLGLGQNLNISATATTKTTKSTDFSRFGSIVLLEFPSI